MRAVVAPVLALALMACGAAAQISDRGDSVRARGLETDARGERAPLADRNADPKGNRQDAAAAEAAHRGASAAPGIVDRGSPADLLRAVDATVAALQSRIRKRAASSNKGSVGGSHDGGPRDAAAEQEGERRALETLRALRQTLGREDVRGSGPVFLGEGFRAAEPAGAFVTGYHEPLLAGRRRPDDRFRFPIYGMPRDDSRGGELPARAAIDRGALAGSGLELAWVDDSIELFFLHVQGSGQIAFEDGTRRRVGFAGTNGRPYRSIGSVLVGRGAFASAAEATAPALKAWLRAHPSEVPSVLHENERYVFFRMEDEPILDGPRGALGAPLTPGRSVAVDPAVTRLGSVGLLRVELPDGRKLDQLVIAMDTGAAIRGPGRIDLFLGSDRVAAENAGLLRTPGSISWITLNAGAEPPE